MQSVHTEPGAWDVSKNIGIDVVLTAASVGPSMVHGLWTTVLLVVHCYMIHHCLKMGFNRGRVSQ